MSDTPERPVDAETELNATQTEAVADTAKIDLAEAEAGTATTEPANAQADAEDVFVMPDMVRIAPGSPDAAALEADTADGQRPSWKRPRTIGLALAALVLIGIVGLAAGQAAGLGSTAPSGLLQTTDQVAPPDEEGADRENDDEADSKAAEEDEGSPEAPESGEGDLDAAPETSSSAPSTDVPASGDYSGDAVPNASAPAADPTPAPEPEPAPAPAPATITVSVYVDSSRAASFGYSSCLASATVSIPQGATVYDALAATGVSVGGSSSYVSSIGGLAEFSCGDASGWLYYVNGYSPGYGPGSYTLSGGESITWVYTLELGADV